MFEDLILAWKIFLSLIILGLIFNYLGRNLLSGILSVILIWFFVFNYWQGFSLIYFIYLFFLFQGIFLIQGIWERKKAEAREKEMQQSYQYFQDYYGGKGLFG